MSAKDVEYIMRKAEAGPTQLDRFFFDNNGYLVLENFLAEDPMSMNSERRCFA